MFSLMQLLLGFALPPDSDLVIGGWAAFIQMLSLFYCTMAEATSNLLIREVAT